MLGKLMIAILIVAFAGLFFVKGPNGEPVLTLEDMMPETPELPEMEATSSEPTKVYKWQDENGVWQFSNKPQDANQGETIELDGNINTMPAVAVPTKTESKPKQTAKLPTNLPAGLTSISGEQMEEMVNTVNGLQDTVDERAKQIEALQGKNN